MPTTQSTTPGIIQLELLPEIESASVVERLAGTIEAATSARMAVAYWTVDPDFVSTRLPQVLGNGKGSLCVDIHYPTDLDALDALHKQGANVRLHLRHLATRTERHWAALPEHLLHTKLLLFDHDDGTAEIWVGSHNWTKRALLGPNIEASAVMRVEQDSSVYQQVVRMLEFVNGQCEPYRPELLDEYKALQRRHLEGKGGEPIMPVIPLAGEDCGNLTGAITIFGKQAKDRERLNDLDQAVLLMVRDSTDTSTIKYYMGTILHLGLQPAANPDAGGLDFSRRRFAFADGEQPWPILVKPRQPDRELLQQAAYFVTIQIQRPIDEAISLHEPPTTRERWVPVTYDPLIARMRPEDRTRLANRQLTMKIPAFVPSEFRRQEQMSLLSELREPRGKLFPIVVWRSVSGIRREPEE